MSGNNNVPSKTRELSSLSVTHQDDLSTPQLTGISWLSSNHLAAVDKANGVVKILDPTRNQVLSRLGEGQLRSPVDVAAIPDDISSFLVTDVKLGTVRLLDERTPSTRVENNVLRRPCRQPHGITFDASNNLVVSDIAEKCILWLPRKSPTTDPLNINKIKSLALEADFKCPMYVAGIPNSDHVVVSDCKTRSLTFLDITGKAVAVSSPGAWQHPKGLDVLRTGEVVCCDFLRGSLDQVGPCGRVERALVRGLEDPVAVSHSPTSCHVAVAEQEGCVKTFALS